MWAAPDVGSYWADLERGERRVAAAIAVSLVVLLLALLTGVIAPPYFMFIVGIAGMYALMSLGLNTQWGYTGLINFSVAAFFGIGAYGTVLISASSSPIREWLLAADAPAVLLNPVVGLGIAIVVATVLALLIAVPTLRLRADYLAIASLGLAEVVRIVVLNERQWTNGSAGVRGIPSFFDGWPVLGTFPSAMPGLEIAIVPGSPVVLETSFWRASLNVLLVVAFLAVSYFVLRRVHRSPWGRVLRTIRSDEDLAKALGKNTYQFKLQAFVLGSLVMALAGVFYAHLNLYVSPGDLDPVTTFYVWVAVILGGSGSNRGALFGGVVVVVIREGTRFIDELAAIPIDAGPLRLLSIGLLILALMRFRPQGILPPRRELIWPDAVEGPPSDPERAVREARGGGDGE